MNIFKKYILSLGLLLGLLLIFSFLITILNYFEILNKEIYKILQIFSIITSITAGSYILGHNSENKGYLNGIILALIIITISIITSIISKNNITAQNIIYYLIIIITSTISSTIGINKKTATNSSLTHQ